MKISYIDKIKIGRVVSKTQGRVTANQHFFNNEFNKKFLWVLEVGFLFSTHKLSVSYKVSGLKKLENFEV